MGEIQGDHIMRLAAHAKGGFYPAAPAAVAMAARWLKPPDKGRFCILDPFAGLGDAIVQHAEALGCKPQDVYAVELDEFRGQTLNERLGNELGCKVLTPASFFGTAVTLGSFSFCWCNPPFDDELGGGRRVELAFLQRSTQLLVSGGVIALVCPEHVACGGDMCEYLRSWYTELRVIKFPAEHRRFQEVVVFGIRRATQVPANEQRWQGFDRRSPDEPPEFVYRLPRSTSQRRFEKTGMSDGEILRHENWWPA
jgi:hypothetical protein